MSCEATPAHASESFEWRIRQHSAEKNSPVNCFSRGKRATRDSAGRKWRRTALLIDNQEKIIRQSFFLNLVYNFISNFKFINHVGKLR